MGTKANSDQGLDLLLKIKPAAVLDIGSGRKERHANLMRKSGIKVDTVDFFNTATYTGDFMEVDIKKKYDAVWTAHCLEHQLNVHNFLLKTKDVLKEDGILCITVPPMKEQVVGGHLTVWNSGLLLYNLVIAGFDCRNAKIKTYGYNISVFVKKNSSIKLPNNLPRDSGELRMLKNFFPKEISQEISSGRKEFFSGNIQELNWNTKKL